MIKVSYAAIVICISIIWLVIRIMVAIKSKSISLKREFQLLLVYVCIIVVVRFTFFPFSKINGQIQPLIFDVTRIIPFRINMIPFIYLFDYPVFKEALLNIIGNTTMFVPVGVIYPIVYKKLNLHKKVILSGVGFSLCIEILQLFFYDRVTDVDDLILNSLGFVLGYGIYLWVKILKEKSIFRSVNREM